jgi:hypothetical protein
MKAILKMLFLLLPFAGAAQAKNESVTIDKSKTSDSSYVRSLLKDYPATCKDVPFEIVAKARMRKFSNP